MNRAHDFFDRIAHRYAKMARRPGGLHQARLLKAVAQVDLSDKKILDLGAGTGILYDHICAQKICCDYLAIDLSETMLQHSAIPQERRQIGSVEMLDRMEEKFDIIFVLGLTTYLSGEENKVLHHKIDGILTEEGSVLISYTHCRSYENRLRRGLSYFLPRDRRFSLTHSMDPFCLGSLGEPDALALQGAWGISHLLRVRAFSSRQDQYHSDWSSPLLFYSDVLFHYRKKSTPKD